MERLKVCNRCELNLPESEFGQNKTKRDGLEYICKTCVSVRARERYQRYRERYIASSMKWQREHPERVEATWRRQYARRTTPGYAPREPRYLAEIPE